ncbi:MAG: homoserine dehydrogenase [bacterium]
MRMLRIGLLGLGHVGSAVVEALAGHGALLARRTGATPALLRIGVRHLHKPRRVAVDPVLLTADAWEVVRDPRVDVVIEAIGGIEPAASYLREALLAGKDVITANKQLVAAHGPELRTLAAERGQAFLFEAAVGAALPIVQVISTALSGDRIRGLVGVLNGTSNYVLTRIERGATREEALADARSLGLAEPDPHDDLNGRDAAAKLAILASLAFEAPFLPHDVPTTGIDALSDEAIRGAHRAGTPIRLIAAARRHGDGFEIGVFPERLAAGHPLARLAGAENGVLLYADLAGEIFLQANGAGGAPTASAILGDLARTAGQLEALFSPAAPAIAPLRSGNGTASDGQLVLDGWA